MILVSLCKNTYGCRKKWIIINSLDDLEGKEIGVVDGYLTRWNTTKKYPKLE